MKLLVGLSLFGLMLLSVGCSQGTDVSNEKSPSIPSAEDQKRIDEAQKKQDPSARTNRATSFPRAKVGEGDALK